jgi:hypothetical protein
LAFGLDAHRILPDPIKPPIFAAHAPTVRLSGLEAGFHVVAHLPDHRSEAEAIAGAHERTFAGDLQQGLRELQRMVSSVERIQSLW